MQLKQNKTHQVYRNHKKIIQNDAVRINSLEKQIEEIIKKEPDTFDNQQKQQNSAIMELLLIKDQQHYQWKEKNVLELIKNYKQKNSKLKCNSNKSFEKISSSQNKFDSEVQSSDLWSRTGALTNIFSKKSTVNCNNRLTHKQHNRSKKHKNQNVQQKQNLPHQQFKRLKQNKGNNLFFMNRTNYWNIKIKNQRFSQMSLTQRLKKNTDLYSTAYKYKQKDEHYYDNEDLIRAASHFGFHRNHQNQLQHHFNQPLDEQLQLNHNNQNDNNNNYIRILSNKAFTVRQMLNKMKSNQNINLLEESQQQNKKISNNLFSSNRQPFNPYIKTSREHYKKFTSFKVQEQKHMEYSVQKLEQYIKINPQLLENNKWAGLQFKYLEKPSYCSWVNRNREKIKSKKKDNSLTVKPLQIIKQN